MSSDLENSREKLKQSLLTAISKVCSLYIQSDPAISSIEGLFGVQFKSEHALLFHVNEQNVNSATNESTPTKQTDEIIPKVDVEVKKEEEEVQGGGEDGNPSTSTAGPLHGNQSKVIGDIAYINLPMPPEEEEHTAETNNTSVSRKLRSTAVQKQQKPNEDPPVLTREEPITYKASSPKKRPILQEESTPEKSKARKLHAATEHTNANQVENSPENVQNSPSGQVDSNKVLTYMVPLDSDKWQCSVCDKTFLSKRGCRRHIMFKHFGRGVECPYCSKIIRARGELDEHIVSAHNSGMPSYQCAECGKWLKSRKTLKGHIAALHKGILNCGLCDESFQNLDYFERHINEAHLRCDLCGVNFTADEGHVCVHNDPSLESDQNGAARSNKNSISTLAQNVASRVIKYKKVTRVKKSSSENAEVIIVDNDSDMDDACEDSDMSESDLMEEYDLGFHPRGEKESPKNDFNGCDFFVVQEIREGTENPFQLEEESMSREPAVKKGSPIKKPARATSRTRSGKK